MAASLEQRLDEQARRELEAERQRHREALAAAGGHEGVRAAAEFEKHMDAVQQIITDHARRDACRAK